MVKIIIIDENEEEEKAKLKHKKILQTNDEKKYFVDYNKMDTRQLKYFYILAEYAKAIKYEILKEYTSAKTSIPMKCPFGHIFDQTPDHFKRGNHCSVCSKKSFKHARIEFYKMAEERGWLILSDYINTDTKVKMKCPNLHIVNITPKHFKEGIGCSICSNCSVEQAEISFHKLAKERKFIILDKYKNAHSKVRMICPYKHTFEITPTKFKSGDGCSRCNLSSIASKIATILDDYEIEYIMEYKLDNKLRYDFYLIEYNSIIEVDGSQHFIHTNIFHDKNEDQFDNSRQRDIIKKQQCINNKIKMIRLDYKWIPTQSNENIMNFLQKCFITKNKLIFYSTPDMYTWMDEKLKNSIYKKYDVKPPINFIIIDE